MNKKSQNWVKNIEGSRNDKVVNKVCIFIGIASEAPPPSKSELRRDRNWIQHAAPSLQLCNSNSISTLSLAFPFFLPPILRLSPIQVLSRRGSPTGMSYAYLFKYIIIGDTGTPFRSDFVFNYSLILWWLICLSLWFDGVCDRFDWMFLASFVTELCVFSRSWKIMSSSPVYG